VVNRCGESEGLIHCNPYASPYFPSKAQLHAVLKLERVAHIAWRTESEVGIGRSAQVRSPVKRVQVLDVGAVEYVEQIGAQFQHQVFAKVNGPPDAQINGGKTRSFQRVPAQEPGAVRSRVSVAVDI